MRLLLLSILTVSLYCQGIAQQLVIDNQGHSGLIHSLNFVENGKLLLSTSEDKTIRVWDVATGTLKQTIRIEREEGLSGKIYASTVSPDGRFLFLGGYFAPKDGNPEAIGEIKIIDLSLNKMLTPLRSHTNVVLDLACSADGKLVSSSADRSISVWDISTLTQGHQPKSLGGITGLDELVNSVAISPDGNVMAAGDQGGYIRTWQIGESLSSGTKTKVHSDQIQQVAYGVDGILYSSGDDGQLIKWTTNGKFLGIMAELPGKVGALAVSIDGRRLVAMGRIGIVYDIASETAIAQFDYHTNSVSAVTAAPFGSFDQQAGLYMASAGGDNKNILIWETQSGKVVRNLVGQGQSVYGIAIDETSDKIALGQNNPSGNLDDIALEKTFDFVAFELNEFEGNANFHGSKKANDNQFLSKESGNSLSFGGNSIFTDPTMDGTLRSYSFTNEGQSITVGSTYSLNRYTTSGERLGSFKGHTSEVWAIAEHTSKELLISGSGDQSIKIWNNLTGENLATLFVSTDNEWVIWTPQGYYEASAGGEKYIGWHVNKGTDQLAEFHDVASFSAKFHRRDVVEAMLSQKSFESVAESIGLKTIEEEQIAPPEISWLSPNNTKSVVMGNEVVFKFEVTSQTPITHIKVMANGRPIVNQTDLNLSGNGNPEPLEVTVTLPEGTNNTYSFSLYVEDANAKVTSEERSITFESGSQETAATTAATSTTQEGERSYLKLDPVEDQQPPSNLYMVSIGVSEFENPDYNLNFAEADANSMADLFENQRGKMFNSVKTFKLVNENATRNKILSTFQKLEQYTTVDDFVIIFIASHGMNVNNQFYIVPHDGNANDPRISCIDWRDFSDLVGNMAAKVLLFIDTCHSGQLGNNIGQKAQNNTEAVRDLSGKEFGVVIMAAAKGEEYSLEHPDWGHGAFTLSILEGIEQRKADVKPDGMVYLRELDYYLAERVRELTGGRQHPTTQKPSSISRLKIAHTE